MSKDLKIYALVCAKNRLETLLAIAMVDSDYKAIKDLSEMIKTIEKWLNNVEE